MDRAPSELAADLSSLAAIDWPRLWSKSPTDPAAWCDQFGWTLSSVLPNDGLEIKLATSASWYVGTKHDNAVWLERSAWYGYSEDSQAVTEAVLAEWDAYLAEISAALGAPHVAAAWDDPNFPDGERWPSQLRQVEQNPFRQALWHLTDATVELVISRVAGGRNTSIVAYVWRPKAS